MPSVSSDLAKYCTELPLDDMCYVRAVRIRNIVRPVEVASALEFLSLTGLRPRLESRAVELFEDERPPGTIGYFVEQYKYREHWTEEEPQMFFVGIGFEYAALMRPASMSHYNHFLSKRFKHVLQLLR